MDMLYLNDEQPPVPSSSGPKIALYSHDTQGLGHVRRNLLIASALSSMTPRPSILLVCGAKEVGAFEVPAGVDCLTLPSIGKSSNGEYRSRHLDIPLSEITGLRSGTIRAAIESFDPDIFIVDKVPLGFQGELIATLRWLEQRGRAASVLGLREVLDDPIAARRDWELDACDSAIRELYDNVWVYGDPLVFDPVKEYAFVESTARKVRYTGYLNPLDVAGAIEAVQSNGLVGPGSRRKRLAVCAVGGGQDGAAIALAFARAPLPSDMAGTIVTGPFMPEGLRAELKAVASRRPGVEVLEFITEPYRLMARADCIVAMGGYNTVCEAMAFGKPTLIVPRVSPRQEQMIRACRLQDLGLLDVLPPDRLSPRALGEWIARAGVGAVAGVGGRPVLHASHVLRFDGVSRLRVLAGELLRGAPLQGGQWCRTASVSATS